VSSALRTAATEGDTLVSYHTPSPHVNRKERRKK
jgi:hypothetical protein